MISLGAVSNAGKLYGWADDLNEFKCRVFAESEMNSFIDNAATEPVFFAPCQLDVSQMPGLLKDRGWLDWQNCFDQISCRCSVKPAFLPVFSGHAWIDRSMHLRQHLGACV